MSGKYTGNGPTKAYNFLYFVVATVAGTSLLLGIVIGLIMAIP